MGDIICLYLSLAIMLLLRFGSYQFSGNSWMIHIKIFSVIFFIWLVVFYIAHLYEIGGISNIKKNLWLILEFQFLNLLLSISFFYIFSIITPKTNLILVSVISTILLFGWRAIFYSTLSKFQPRRVLLLGRGLEIEQVQKELGSNYLGYQFFELVEEFEELRKSDIEKIIFDNNIQVVVIKDLMTNPKFYRKIFQIGFKKVQIFDLATFYEMIFKKIPLNLLGEAWFLSNVNWLNKKIYDSIKRILDSFLAVVGLIISSVFWPFIILGIKISSPGEIFYTNWRVGQGGKKFKIIKFRTMINFSDKANPQWIERDDKRINKFGRFLRVSHLDEIPQFISIIRGEMSFVGPRPERVDLVEVFSNEIPFYDVRHLIKPGLIGWAQYNHPHSRFSSLEENIDDTKKKVEYDLYYLKNRSLWLDISIMIRAIRIFFTQKTS